LDRLSSFISLSLSGFRKALSRIPVGSPGSVDVPEEATSVDEIDAVCWVVAHAQAGLLGHTRCGGSSGLKETHSYLLKALKALEDAAVLAIGAIEEGRNPARIEIAIEPSLLRAWLPGLVHGLNALDWLAFSGEVQTRIISLGRSILRS